MQLKQFIITFIKYCLVGIVNTIVSLVVMVGLKFLGVNYLVYTAIAYVLGMGISFWLNFKVTFVAKGVILKRFINFIAINLINLAIVELLQWLFVEYFSFKEIIAVGVGMIFYTVFGFLANRKFVFYVAKINLF